MNFVGEKDKYLYEEMQKLKRENEEMNSHIQKYEAKILEKT